MSCPRCRTESLKPILTAKGVMVDSCRSCGGIWLDKGELYLFSDRPARLKALIEEGRREGSQSGLKSPKTGRPMQEFPVATTGIRLDQCAESGGIWLDGGELERLPTIPAGIEGLRRDSAVGHDETPLSPQDPSARLRMAQVATGLTPLPNLAIRSGGVVFSLYALLVFGLILLAEVAHLPPSFPLVAGILLIVVEFLISPFLMDLTLRWTQGLRWIGLGDLPRGLSAALQRICQGQGMRVPRLGLIEDGNPNAFTYGHTPGDARLILTRGILGLLQEDEAEAVIAHEVGHAKHWDMLVMTAAQLVPLVFYTLYRICMQSRPRSSSSSGSKEEGKEAAGRLIVGLGAFLLYIVSEYLVLWLSRTREYFADRFAGEVTGRPSSLASALVKIAYGMAGQRLRLEEASPPAAGRQPAGRSEESAGWTPAVEAVRALGLFDPRAARALAIASAPAQRPALGEAPPRAPAQPGLRPLGGEINKEALKQAMRWDRWNPWAKYYELQSTHPLVANRLQYLGEQAAAMKQEPFILFNLLKPESYWDEFAVDLGVMWLPLIVGTAGFLVGWLTGSILWAPAWALVGLGLGMLGQVPFQYPAGPFPELSIASLLKQVKVSAVRPVPCTLKGTIIGRGVPGLIWSEDFVLQDESGILFLDYRQPLAIWEFFFGLMRGAQLQGESVTVT
ncbi:MAG: M48 family metalloprotease, partial [Candidatus Omnitrophica bacterium]|nr:M48 family metalloprotease [Candidatus Omnitrophota bacterium]